MNRAAKIRATKIRNIMEDFQVSMDEAEQMLLERERNWGRKGGKATGKSKVRSREHYSSAGKKGAIKRWHTNKLDN